MIKTAKTMEERFADLQLAVSNLTEVNNCLTNGSDSAIIKQTLSNISSDVGKISSSVLKSAPKVLFKHKGKVTHHITAVGDRNLICRAGSN